MAFNIFLSLSGKAAKAANHSVLQAKVFSHFSVCHSLKSPLSRHAATAAALYYDDDSEDDDISPISPVEEKVLSHFSLDHRVNSIFSRESAPCYDWEIEEENSSNPIAPMKEKMTAAAQRDSRLILPPMNERMIAAARRYSFRTYDEEDNSSSIVPIMEDKPIGQIEKGKDWVDVLTLCNKKCVRDITNFPREVLESNDRLWELFEVWMVEYNRKFADEETKQRKFKQFKWNVADIQVKNGNTHLTPVRLFLHSLSDLAPGERFANAIGGGCRSYYINLHKRAMERIAEEDRKDWEMSQLGSVEGLKENNEASQH